MTKRLSPERLAEIFNLLESYQDEPDDSEDSWPVELRKHIEAVEAELVYPVNRVVALEKELAEARAEIARLEEKLDHMAYPYG